MMCVLLYLMIFQPQKCVHNGWWWGINCTWGSSTQKRRGGCHVWHRRGELALWSNLSCCDVQGLIYVVLEKWSLKGRELLAIAQEVVNFCRKHLTVNAEAFRSNRLELVINCARFVSFVPLHASALVHQGVYWFFVTFFLMLDGLNMTGQSWKTEPSSLIL